MTSYIVRADDGREFPLGNGPARQLRIQAFNVLLHEDIRYGTVVSIPKGREMWRLDTLYATYGRCPVSDDSSPLWTPIAHRIGFATWGGLLVIDRELYDEGSIRRMLGTEYDFMRADLDSRAVGWVRYEFGPNEFEVPGCYRLSDTQLPRSYPVWTFGYTMRDSTWMEGFE